MATNDLTAERLRELLDYNPDAGVFTRRLAVGRNGGKRIGALCGNTKQNGYRYITIDRQTFREHRVVFLHVYGDWPSGQVDHINGIKTDNRLANLRIVTQTVNQQNQRRAKANNKLGLLGVTLDKRYGTFQASIRHSGKKMHLGSFQTKELAHAAYLNAKRRFHDGCSI